ncbi:TIGR02710 family CRISPR-associated CARF protein [Hydrogenibacillus sp. N12]|uniref:TIGR02710 family CRISPR-associated CARF protein n=1 Tax=Hydrogenibacillus sp. N12 TaxID=2866627 RepID=UPI001C7E1B93|nr:TIGR02710 family CRISPR-associated CARF protein [Hydrogenibacillus sp. N12]QZA33214.1 TIGR02710 family CRISPR-associated protein [Hydrogenibacillus sp. N12]
MFSNPVEQEQFYQERIWPLIREGFSRDIIGGTKYAASFHTVGRTPEPIILSIQAIDAEKVFLLHTLDNLDECDRIAKELGLPVSRVRLIEIQKGDIEDIYKKVRDKIVTFSRDQRLAVDLTGGTKAMAAGLAMIAMTMAQEEYSIDIFYVDSEYDKEENNKKKRRPIAGTEFIRQLENPRHVFTDWVRQRARTAYAEGHYSEAVRLLQEVARQEGRIDPPEATLAQAYAAMESGDFVRAHEELNYLIQQLNEPAHRRHPLRIKIHELKAQKDAFQRLNRLIQVAGTDAELEPLADPVTIRRTLSIFRSIIEYRMRENRLAEATLLSYRSLELYFQHRLARWGLRTARPEWAALRDRHGVDLQALDERYREERRRAIDRRQADDERPQETGDDSLLSRKTLDLTASYFLLRALGDEPIIQWKNLPPGRLLHLASLRNHSLFAHGFRSPNERDSQLLIDLVQELQEDRFYDESDPWTFERLAVEAW